MQVTSERTSPRRLLVFEFLCGGGVRGEPWPESIGAQGMAMLSACVEDLLAAGVEVRCPLDDRLRHHEAVRDWPGDVITPIGQAHAGGSLPEMIRRLANGCDHALIIAPETEGILVDWLTRFERWGVQTMNASPAAAALCGDKQRLEAHLIKHGIATPASLSPAALRDCRDGRVIVKPVDGAGCEQTFTLAPEQAYERFVDPETEQARNGWLIQRLAPGDAASVSFLVPGDASQPVVTPLLAGWQRVVCGRDGAMQYDGGTLPLPPALADRAIEIAMNAARSVDGLRGFVGVDVMLNGEAGGEMGSEAVIEINPRLTVSYCALRHLCAGNLMNAWLRGAKPEWRSGSVSFDAAGRERERVSP